MLDGESRESFDTTGEIDDGASGEAEMTSTDPSRCYDDWGVTYRHTRRPDPRIAAAIEAALGDATTIVNVGAGTGSYEPPSRRVVAIEPSAVMIKQRAANAAPALLGVAEALPFPDRSFDAATAFLTVHHWSDRPRGLREMRRVARSRVVILTYVPDAGDDASLWLRNRYFPAIGAAVRAAFPPLELYRSCLGPCRAVPVPIPADCSDGFLDAFWARPELYLEAQVRAGIFWFERLDRDTLDDGLRRLDRDLRDGSWDRQFGYLRTQPTLDAGLRLVAANLTEGA